MNRSEALKIFNLEEGFSEEQLNKAYRKLAAKLHPDVNHEDGASERFVKISSAYEYLKKNPRPQSDIPNARSYNWHMWDMMNKVRNIYDDVRIEKPVNINISFVESLQGCSKNIKYKASLGCPDCNRSGRVAGQQKKCEKCNGTGYVGADREAVVTLPPGIQTGVVQVITPMNDFVRLNISVEQHPTIKRFGNFDVISIIEVSLLEALEGTSKSVETIKGKKKLKIPPGTKNADQLRIKGGGVAGLGHHYFKVDVSYPTDTSSLIKFLKETE